MKRRHKSMTQPEQEKPLSPIIKKRSFVLVIVLAMLFICQAALAHPGGLDSNNGHKDNKNKSGLGSYHYHCGDHPAHLHGASGLCPYSADYKAYKAMVDELMAYSEKVASDKEGRQASEVLTVEELERMEVLLLNEFMPFRLTEELLDSETTQYGKTNVKGLNVRKKESTGSSKVCAISLTGSVLLVSEDKGNGWLSILAHEDGKNYTGFVKAEMVDLIDKPEYLINLCGYLK